MYFQLFKDKISLDNFSFSHSIKRQKFFLRSKKKLTLIGMCRCNGPSVERKSRGAIFSFNLRSHVHGISYTRFHASVLSSIMALMCLKITGESSFSYSFCGGLTLIIPCVRISFMIYYTWCMIIEMMLNYLFF